MGGRGRHRIITAMAVVALSACGGDDDIGSLGELAEATVDGTAQADVAEAASAVNDALGAGGGGSLIFDGVEYPIVSVLCADAGGRVDIGTVDAFGNRVLIMGQPGDLAPQILIADGATMTQWFDGSPSAGQGIDAEITESSGVWSTPDATWWNNQDDRVVSGSFTVECP